MTRPLSATLELRQSGRAQAIHCAACGHALGPAGEAWKPAATVRERPMAGIAGAPYSTGAKVLLREFFCPGCGALLDAETALPGDPFLTDVVRP
jgi:acetone carboxylase gamma subunit